MNEEIPLGRLVDAGCAVNDWGKAQGLKNVLRWDGVLWADASARRPLGASRGHCASHGAHATDCNRPLDPEVAVNAKGGGVRGRENAPSLRWADEEDERLSKFWLALSLVMNQKLIGIYIGSQMNC